jgi:Na+/H+-dicarboxylate symporter
MPMDQLVDPARTAANVNSTLVNSLMVDKWVGNSEKKDAKKAAKRA